MRKFIMSVTTVASLSLAAIPVLGLTQAANAAEREPTTARIAYGDLNLADPTQARIFKARVETAATKLCRDKMDSIEGLTMPLSACVVDGQDQAKRQLSIAQRQALAQGLRAATVQVAAK